MNKLKALTLLLVFPMIALAQPGEEEKIRELVKTADESELVMESSSLLQSNYYFFAEIVVDKLLEMNPASSNYNYRKGFLLLGSRGDYLKAMEYLKKAAENTDKNYDFFSHKELSAPIDVYYHLGRCYHLDENLVEARKYYSLFIQESGKKSEVVELAKLNLAQCDVAEELINHPKSAIVENIGNKVNTSVAEYAPVISLDGTSLYFTTRRPWPESKTAKYKSEELRDPMLNNYPEDIFVSYSDFEGEWTSPEKLAFCDIRLNEATIAVSSDERKIFVYNDVSGGGDIYYSEFGGNKFEEIRKLRYNQVNSDYWETHCTVTPDGENMYFVSDRPGGFGGRDIYRIVKLPNGEWSDPFNMGPGINTAYDEDSPFIAVNNKTLYYSSNGPSSMGGFDVFVAFRDENNNWSEPVNMGYPINSTGDDIFYTTTIDGLRGYLSSFRKGGYGEKDIYEIRNDYLGNRPISSLRGFISSVNGEPVPENMTVRLECSSCQSDENKITYPRIKGGKFFSVLGRCRDYTVNFYKGEELVKSESFTTLCNAENEELETSLLLGEYTLAGTVSDEKLLNTLENSKVEFLSVVDESVVSTYDTDKAGAFVSDYLKGKEAGDRIRLHIRVSKEGYLTRTFIWDTVLGTASHIQLDYLITKEEVGVDISFLINPIYFDLDKSNIRPDAAIELDKIVKIMNDNPELKIELGSHTDCRASIEYNRKLSSRRATSSAKYIKQRITNPSRIYGKGYGESQLVNDCACEGDVVSDCSDEEHQANRRTEFRIIK